MRRCSSRGHRAPARGRLFDRVVNIADGGTAPPNVRAARLRRHHTRLGAGNRALRYMVGFGAGARKRSSRPAWWQRAGRVLIATADRREASFGLFGGDSEEHLREAFSDMARTMRGCSRDCVPPSGPPPSRVARATARRSTPRHSADVATAGTRRNAGHHLPRCRTRVEYTRSNSPYGTERSSGTGRSAATRSRWWVRWSPATAERGPIGQPHLRREGARRVGTAFGAYNLPRPVTFERGQ